ncbi:hypothetical protein EYF80_054990 [Liparis tanakae]|uniref:Uncharacterized protein n=1 Tax=Liparis tanakae TaxID=230148 RepID=A0A4Z2F1K4_9TELE|nr:hypothetical protein EYF80_054990 [Liparis tanakae]
MGQALPRLAQGYNLVVRGYNLVVRGYNLVAQGYNLVARGYNLVVRGYNLVAQGYNLVVRGYNLVAQGYNLVVRGYNLVARGYNLVARGYNLVARGYNLVVRGPVLWGLMERKVFRGAGLPIMAVFLRTEAGAGRFGRILIRLNTQGGVVVWPPSLWAISLATAIDLAKESSEETGFCFVAASSSLMNSAATFSASFARILSFFFHVNFPNEGVAVTAGGGGLPVSRHCLRSFALMAGLGPQRILGGS